MSPLTLSKQDIQAIEALRRSGKRKEALLEILSRAYMRARSQAKVRVNPRNLSSQHLAIMHKAMADLGLSESDLLKLVHDAARWAMDEYTQTARSIDKYSDLSKRCKPLNDVLVALMGIDLTKADGTVGRAASANRAAMAKAGGRAVGALAATKVLDAHHIVEQRWWKIFQDKVSGPPLNWTSVDSMDAIALPVDVHQRSLAGMLERLGQDPEPTKLMADGYTEITRVLQNRLLAPEKFDALSKAELESGLYIKISPEMSARELIQAHIDVYSSEKNLAYLNKVIQPHLQALMEKMP